MHSPTPWRWQEMTATIAIRDANGHTICNLPPQGDKAKRRANAEMIVRAVNSLAQAERDDDCGCVDAHRSNWPETDH